jgi:hypothetical protein
VEPFIPEVLPEEYVQRIAADAERLFPGGANDVARGMINELKAWSPGLQALRVCFFDGSAQLRERIATVAKGWLRNPVGIKLDFGTGAGLRSCGTSQDHIRIGFQYAGYWSLVGQDSYASARQNEQSMNFQGFLQGTPQEREFNRVVLHEFGHALGFEHEHQHPWSRCKDEFDWPAINRYLQGPPNNWSQQQIDFNMKQLASEDKVLSRFDPASIMLYTFPDHFYKRNGPRTCYSAGNHSLSAGDLSLLASVYPADRRTYNSRWLAAINTYIAALRAQRSEPEVHVQALQTLVRFTDGALPSEALDDVPAEELPAELRNAPTLQ